MKRNKKQQMKKKKKVMKKNQQMKKEKKKNMTTNSKPRSIMSKNLYTKLRILAHLLRNLCKTQQSTRLPTLLPAPQVEPPQAVAAQAEPAPVQALPTLVLTRNRPTKPKLIKATRTSAKPFRATPPFVQAHFATLAPTQPTPLRKGAPSTAAVPRFSSTLRSSSSTLRSRSSTSGSSGCCPACSIIGTAKSSLPATLQATLPTCEADNFCLNRGRIQDCNACRMAYGRRCPHLHQQSLTTSGMFVASALKDASRQHALKPVSTNVKYGASRHF